MISNSALTIGTILKGNGIKYKIVDVLGQGGFGITYLAIGEVVVGNVPAEVKFAIKEHFPTTSTSCERNGSNVIVDDNKSNAYKSSLTDFIAEAKKLHSLGAQNENIVKVNEVFEENGTAYYVMQYINGESLSSYVKSKGKLSYTDAVGLLSPIFDAVDFLHSSRINHLDIKPENIMLHRGVDGITPILIDFGLSVHFKKNGDKTSPKGVEGVSEGYSPLEQYAGIKEFNPATDIYALAATLLFAITGKTPKSASEIRMSEVRNTLADKTSQTVTDGICKALIKADEDRTQSVKAFKSDLGIAIGGGSETQIIEKDDNNKKRLFKIIFGVSVILFAIIIAIYLFTRPTPSPQPEPQPSPTDSIQTEQDVHESNVNEPIIETQTQSEPQSETKPTDNSSEKPVPSSSNASSSTNQTSTSTIPSKPEVREGSISLGYGTWKGGIKNGKPDGKGTLTFSSSHRVDRSSSYEANPGDYFIATYDNGSLISGKLYDSSGNLLSTIIP